MVFDAVDSGGRIMAQVGEHGLDGVLRGCVGSSFGHRCHDLGLGLGRGLRLRGPFLLAPTAL